MRFNFSRPVNHQLSTIFQCLIISITFFFLILSSNNLFAAQVKLSFTPSPDSRVIGHKIHYGKSTSFGTVVDLGNATTFLTPDLSGGTTYYFAAKAYDKYGNESAFSNTLSYKIPDNTLTPTTGTDTTTNNATQYKEDFQIYSIGDTPPDWLDTGAYSSLNERNGLFEIFGVGSNKIFGTTSTLSNIHSHYIGPNFGGLTSFEYTGRMVTTNTSGGMGVTFLSQYPFADAYYRLRSFNKSSFHISPHLQGVTVSGITDSKVIPKANEWYQFRIKAQVKSSRTEILAKVWPQNASEPSSWQINAYDASPNRLVDGTFGLWSHGTGSKFWDDLELFQ
jgi:hypothetical protein